MVPETPEPGGYEDPFVKSDDDEHSIPDPIEPVNQLFFRANVIYYIYGLNPASGGYKSVTTQWSRRRVELFFHNLKEPVTVVNGIFQGEIDDAATASKRFLINTIFGAGGLFDPASQHHERVVRGFDQTLAKWGIGHGFYIHWPIVGPSSARATGGLVLEEAMNPFWWARDWRVTAGGLTLETVSWNSEQGKGYRDILLHSVDGYTAMKHIFEQTTKQRATR